MKTCPKCNLSYNDDKKFCKSCGNTLEENNSTTTGSKLNNTSLFLIIIIAWDALNRLIWLFIQFVILPQLYTKGKLW